MWSMDIELELGDPKTSIFYREFGEGPPLLFLHGGWGYEMYPFDHQIRDFHQRFRILIPDRAGYGRSSRTGAFPRGFHKLFARETTAFMDALGIESALLWGHSDGAVTAALMGIDSSDRVDGIIMEATHYDRRKPRSKSFFETAAMNPAKFGEKVAAILSNEHGEGHWRNLIENHGSAWLDIHDGWEDPEQDMYGGRLSELRVPTILIHGSEDPRTEPGELDTIQGLLPDASIHVIAGGGHSPHSESGAWEHSNRVAADFFRVNPGSASTVSS